MHSKRPQSFKKKFYDDGGEIEDPKANPQPSPEPLTNQDDKKTMQAQNSMRDAFHYAEGGEVAGEDKFTHLADNEDSDIHKALGEELMGAFESKDPNKIFQGLEALILSCLSGKE